MTKVWGLTITCLRFLIALLKIPTYITTPLSQRPSKNSKKQRRLQMLKSIMLISILSIFITSAAYIPNAKANWLEDAVKEKLKRELRKKVRKEARRGQGHHRKNRKPNHHRKNNGHKTSRPVRIALQQIRDTRQDCTRFSSTWRQEARCFKSDIRNIRESIDSDLQYKRLNKRSYKVLNFAQRKLSNILRTCPQRANTWKQEAQCFDIKLKRIAHNMKNNHNR